MYRRNTKATRSETCVVGSGRQFPSPKLWLDTRTATRGQGMEGPSRGGGPTLHERLKAAVDPSHSSIHWRSGRTGPHSQSSRSELTTRPLPARCAGASGGVPGGNRASSADKVFSERLCVGVRTLILCRWALSDARNLIHPSFVPDHPRSASNDRSKVEATRRSHLSAEPLTG